MHQVPAKLPVGGSIYGRLRQTLHGNSATLQQPPHPFSTKTRGVFSFKPFLKWKGPPCSQMVQFRWEAG